MCDYVYRCVVMYGFVYIGIAMCSYAGWCVALCGYV